MSTDVTVGAGHDKINNLQVVRAAAALLVAYFHTNYAPGGSRPFGSFGVDIFFVLSGFIMAGICARNPDAFFRRRLVRIVPPYWLFTLFVFGVAALVPSLVQATRADPVQLLKSLFFIPFRKANGLIQPTLFLGWTLNYEMFFYAAVSAGLALSRRWAVLVASGLIVMCLAICSVLRGSGAIPEFYANPIMVEFILGIGCYHLYRRCPALGRGWAVGFALLIAGSLLWMIQVQACGLGPDLLLAGDRELFGQPALTIIFSAAMLAKCGWDARVGWLVLIGDASYVLYLVHPYCELGLGKLIGKRLPALMPETHLLGAIFVVAVATLIAVALHLWVERPLLAVATRWLIPARGNRGAVAPPRSESATV